MDQCYGIIPLRQTKEGIIELLVVKSSKGHWGLPKGHPEEGENALETAQRELLEETNMSVASFLSLSPIVEKYAFVDPKRGKVEKRVDYYLAFVIGNLTFDQKEIAEAKFVPLQDAMALLTYPESKQVCREAILCLLKEHLNK